MTSDSRQRIGQLELSLKSDTRADDGAQFMWGDSERIFCRGSRPARRSRPRHHAGGVARLSALVAFGSRTPRGRIWVEGPARWGPGRARPGTGARMRPDHAGAQRSGRRAARAVGRRAHGNGTLLHSRQRHRHGAGQVAPTWARLHGRHAGQYPGDRGERSGSALRVASVSSIVVKLLAKTAEERYQTAGALGRDFRPGLAEWNARRRIDDFLLAELDAPDRILTPENLYAHELETLLAAFDGVVKSGSQS